MSNNFYATAISGIGEIRKDENIGDLIASALGSDIENGDIFVIASKIVSKSQGREVFLKDVVLSEQARELAAKTGKPVEVCQIVLNECSKVFLSPHGTLIGIHKLGFRLTSGGVDKYTKESVMLIPSDPDQTATDIRVAIEKVANKQVSVLIVDSDGRDDRKGAISVALGVSGFSPIQRTEHTDVMSGKLKYAEEDLSAMLANAGALLLGQRSKGTPVVLIRGLELGRNLTGSIVRDVLSKVE